jgi:phosphoglycerate kinase
MNPVAVNQLPSESLQGNRVLVRVDAAGVKPSLPTLRYLTAAKSRLIVATSSDDGPVLAALARELENQLECSVQALSVATGPEVLRAVLTTVPRNIVLLGNLGRYPEETANDPGFARRLASLAEIYCDDAFAIAHRSLASTVGVTRYVRMAVAGLNMAREVARMERVMGQSEPPFLAILGGTAQEEQLVLLEQFLRKAGSLFVGGTFCFPFLKLRGAELDASLIDSELVEVIKGLVARNERRAEIVLPVDFVVVDRKHLEALHESTPAFETVASTNLLPSHVPVDIGPRTLCKLEALLVGARTLLWHGPLGAWEVEPFGTGTREVLHQVAVRVGADLQGVVCGDSLARALHEFGLPSEQIRDMISPSQATVQLLAGRPLPAVEALMKVSCRSAQAARALRVLLPVDGSPESLRVIERAASVLSFTEAEVRLLFIEKRSHEAIEGRLGAKRALELADAELSRHGIIVRDHHIMEGEPAECIVNFAQEISADFAIVERQELPRPLRMLRRDVTRKILDHAKCPILAIRIS